MPKRSATTTRPRQGPPTTRANRAASATPGPPALGELQRAALLLAGAQGWIVAVEAGGQLHRLNDRPLDTERFMPGRRLLVLALSTRQEGAQDA